MRKANLFIVGQPKSGTTALHEFLDEHPDIFMGRPKEPHFFCTDFHRSADAFHSKKDANLAYEFRTEEEYSHIYEGWQEEAYAGEASTNYLYSQDAAKNIHAYNPDAKIVMILREPAEFLFLLHRQYVNETHEDIEDFREALAAVEERKKGKNLPERSRCPEYLFYPDRITFSEQVQRYFDLFPRENILVFLFDEYVKDNAGAYKNILELLDVDTSFTPDFRQIHGSKVPKRGIANNIARSPFMRRWPRKILPTRVYDKLQVWMQARLMKVVEPSKMDPEIRRKLMKQYKPEIEKLSGLLGRDVGSFWGYDNI